MRLFVAIELTEPAFNAVCSVRQHLVPALDRQGVRFVKPEKLHLALAFLGEVESDQVSSLERRLQSLSELAPFNLKLATLGAFPDMRRPKVIWIGLDGDVEAAANLSRRVAAVCEPFAPQLDEKPFAPHITLARLKPGSREAGRMLASLEITPPEARLPVDEFVLVHSKPSGDYDVLQRIALQAI